MMIQNKRRRASYIPPSTPRSPPWSTSCKLEQAISPLLAPMRAIRRTARWRLKCDHVAGVWGKAHLALYVKLPVAVCSQGLIALGGAEPQPHQGSANLFNLGSPMRTAEARFGGCRLPRRACFSALRTGGGCSVSSEKGQGGRVNSCGHCGRNMDWRVRSLWVKRVF